MKPEPTLSLEQNHLLCAGLVHSGNEQLLELDHLDRLV